MNKISKENLKILAKEFGCEANDPIFAILVKIDEYQSAVEALASQSMQSGFSEFYKTSQDRLLELNHAIDKLGEFKDVFTKEASLISEAVFGLEYYFKQARWHYALISAAATLICCLSIGAAIYYESPLYKLKSTGINVLVDLESKTIVLDIGKDKRLLPVTRRGSEIIFKWSN